MSDVKVALIGHRGVGKTDLLERLQNYFPQFQYLDLDAVISKKMANPIYKIFDTFGEDYFRSKEVDQAHELLNKKDIVVSLGAGFQLENLPEDVICIWIRRPTDSGGRIFLNRPTLNSKLKPLDDYLSRFDSRNKKYFDHADYIYDMPEGIQLIESRNILKKNILGHEKNLFKDILFRTSKKRKGILTINSHNIGKKVFYDTVELRTDIFSAKDIVQLVGSFRKISKVIVSFRKQALHDLDDLSDSLAGAEWVDIDCSFQKVIARFVSENPKLAKKKLIISSHEETVSKAISQLESTAKLIGKPILKCSPIIKSYAELKILFDWFKEDPKRRLIFPRSLTGDWKWFRCFMLSKQNMNFINDGFSSVADQPTMLDSVIYADVFLSFSGVIGNPIQHSYSPVFHNEFMKERNSPYFGIKIEEKEFDFAMEFLESIGLRAVSITAPFKESVYRKYKDRLANPQSLKSVNTLTFLSKNKTAVTNTDETGIMKTLSRIAKDDFKKPLDKLSIILWGGGGVVAAIKQQVPSVVLVASRQGQLSEAIKNIDILIWAAPRSLLTKIPKNCTIKMIFDLSYVSNSMGLELAKENNIPYVSGLEMFKEQGLGQQIFWSQFDERK